MHLEKTAGNSTVFEILPPLHCIHLIALSTVCSVINGIDSICKIVKDIANTSVLLRGKSGAENIFEC